MEAARAHTAPLVSAPSELPYRALDLTLVLLTLPLTLLLGTALALAILVDSPGPLLYRCRRLGRGGRPFWMLKFRKMRADAQGPSVTAHDDKRFTPIGKFLCATRLDELPQLWNVLKGDMRLVGPRPELEEFVALHPDEYCEILLHRPGLTGLAQLEFFQESRFFRDPDRSVATYTTGILPRKVELDLRYIRARSLRLDLRVLALTVVLPLRAAGRALLRSMAGVPRSQAIAYLLLALCVAAVVTAYASQP